MAENKNENQQSQTMMDKTYVVEGFDPSKLQNADVNLSQYWDDSSEANYNNPSLWGGENTKYTGENTLGSQVAYNPNATVEGLDPNYLYWQEAQMQNSKEANYIAKRNDEIASALYNAWKTSIQDVNDFLDSQRGFYNSVWNERANTVTAVWKRIGQIAKQNEKSDEPQAEWDKTPEQWNNDALNNMQSDLNKSTGGELYGKVTADQSTHIKTLEDENSVYKSMNEARISTFKKLQGMSSEKVAYLMNEGKNIFSDQAMRDLMQYDPAKYEEIQKELKKIRGQEQIDKISTNWKMDVTSQLDSDVDNVNSEMNNFVNSTASERDAGQLSTNLSNALSESEIVTWAREQMEVYKRKIQEIQDAADELPKLANEYFKWDTPQYIINAFVSNRMQQYNKELQKYQNLYNATLDEAKFEISQTQWREEMNYKWANLQADQNYKNANLELSRQEYELNRQKAAISNWQRNTDWSYSYVDMSWIMHTLSKSDAEKVLNRDLYEKSTSYIDYWKNKIEEAKANNMELYWEQCEVMSDNYTRQYFGTEMRAEDWSWITTAKRKAEYATEALPQRGFVAVWDYWIIQDDWKNYGHTGIVIDYDPVTGKFTTLESNFKKWKNWQPIITIEEHSINSSSLQGFWDPSKWDPTKKWNSYAVDEYMQLPNWMLDVFINAEVNANWVEAQKYVRQAREGYWILNLMINNWEMRAILDWDDAANAVDTFTKYLLENASNRKIVDENWNFFLDTALQWLLNSWVKMDPLERNALSHLYRMVQIKLRRDSWAAINIWEWMWDFNMYLPQVWLSKQQKIQRLFDLERAALESAMPWEYVRQYVPLLTFDDVNNEPTEIVGSVDDLTERTMQQS